MADSNHSGKKPHHRFIDMTGRRFGRLVVLHTEGKYRAEFCWRVRCDCGTEKRVLGTSLRAGRIKSCGCAIAEILKAANTTHGMRNAPEYNIWAKMRERCTKASYQDFQNYGGRGIAICERWQQFANFYADMGPRPSAAHTLDRIDVNGDYAPGNCRWATRAQQARNKRGTLYLEYKGQQLPMADVADLIGVTYATLENRIRRGDTGERLFRPTRTRIGRLNH